MGVTPCGGWRLGGRGLVVEDEVRVQRDPPAPVEQNRVGVVVVGAGAGASADGERGAVEDVWPAHTGTRGGCGGDCSSRKAPDG